jgi:hypothetical protein
MKYILKFIGTVAICWLVGNFSGLGFKYLIPWTMQFGIWALVISTVFLITITGLSVL